MKADANGRITLELSGDAAILVEEK
jgi:hypothetical protein